MIFYSRGEPAYEMHCYHATHFAGTPRPTRAMVDVGWFTYERLPFDEMFESDRSLYRRFFALRPFRAYVYYRTGTRGLILPIEFLPFSP